MDIGQLWNVIILSPLMNILIVVSHYLANSFGLAIIALTIIVNLAMLPLTLRQIKSTQAMQTIQPQIAELQKKYARDRQRLAQEQMRLYREAGMSPAGCLVPMIVQMPIWIALYQAIIRLLAVIPEDFLSLSQHLYSSWPIVFSMVPLEKGFLWLDLAQPDMFLALLVGATMWIQQKMTMVPPTDPRQARQSQMMLWMMPVMFAFFALSFPSGLSLFWVTSSVVRIAMQYNASGWTGLFKKAATNMTSGKNYKKQFLSLKAAPPAGDKAKPSSKPKEE